MSNEQLQTQSAIPKSVKGWLASDYFREQVKLTLPKHMTAERFVRVALTALTRIPKLAECTPASVLKCLMTCSELGLEPDGRRYHLIPFWNNKLQVMECQGIVDYKGLVELVRNNGDVASIHADLVCDKDEFSYRNGQVTHAINFREDRGKMFAAYVVIKFKDGSEHTEVMTRADIDAIRARSKAKDSGPWVTDFGEMARKTVFRRASKWITLSPEIADALDKDSDSLPALNGSLVDELTGPAEPRQITGDPQEDNLDMGETTKPKTETPLGAETAKLGRGANGGTAQEGGKLHTVQESLAEIVTGGGFTFDQFRTWADELGALPNVMSFSQWSELPSADCKRLIGARVGLLKGLALVVKGSPV